MKRADWRRMAGIACLMIVAAGRMSAQRADTLFASSPIPDSIFQRMQGRSYKAGCTTPREELRYLRLSYCDAEGRTRQGEMVCHQSIAPDLVDIFRQLWQAGYPIGRMLLIDEYDADDERSMEANNTSCFNYRTVSGTQTVSKHGRGLAVDVNPLFNPYVRGSRVSPRSGHKWAFRRQQRTDIPMKIDRSGLCYRLFLEHGFRWGGAWHSCQDYQHFEK